MKNITATTTSPHYLVKIWYEEADRCYIAEVPALPGCVTYGKSYAQAAARVEEAIDAWLESAARHTDPIPAPDIAAEQIASFGPLLSIAKLAREAGLNQHTLASKLRRKSRFTDVESKAIRKALAVSA
jgi:predicted RNase H-like HicB family nuclease